jgi:hypothetical protein
MGTFDEIEVCNRYTGAWGAGFELQDAEAHLGETRFRIRRRSDGFILPGWFSDREVRPLQSPRDPIVRPSSDD